MADSSAELIGADALAGLPHGFSTAMAKGEEGVALPGTLVLARQVHSLDVVTVTAPFPDGERPAADALVTDRQGLMVGVVTADCAPILLADRAAGVVGAAHAGWRGAVGGVIGNTVAAMENLGADRSRIVAVIGPCIAQGSYEVAADMRDSFPADAHRFFGPGVAEDRWQFDLSGYVAHRLREAGVGIVDALGRDTYAEPDTFHSYRRATHRGEPTGGRQISAIGIG